MMSKSGLGASKIRFWTLWGAFWKPFGCSGAHFGCLWNALGCRLGIPWASKTFFEAFETHLGAIWELYGVDLESICAFSAPHSDKGTPALPRFAPRSVTICCCTSKVDDYFRLRFACQSIGQSDNLVESPTKNCH